MIIIYKYVKINIMLNEENLKKKNFYFIKDFVLKLIISKEENEKNILYEIYSDNSSDENEKEKNKNSENK